MTMNPDLNRLHPYPFEKLAQLTRGIEPPAHRPLIALSIGEPQQATPSLVGEALTRALPALAKYPTTRGSDTLRTCMAEWLCRRFDLPAHSVDPQRHILPVNGTREALFAFAQAAIDRSRRPVVIIPNPFYQIYEGAALLAGAEPYFVNTTAQTHWLPDFDAVPAALWQRCQLIYVCSPGNPTGAVLSFEQWRRLLDLADRHDLIIAADECYSEIYHAPDHPPVGLLQAAYQSGNDRFRRCMVFHSLSKRSSAPGLRSGFVAGDADLIQRFLLYRTYHGCAMSLPVQQASIAAWSDETHVHISRDAYRKKITAAAAILEPVLPVTVPEAGFYLWVRTPYDDEQFARDLYQHCHVSVLPGRYLSRPTDNGNPGADHVRMALVAEYDQCIEAAQRIRTFLAGC